MPGYVTIGLIVLFTLSPALLAIISGVFLEAERLQAALLTILGWIATLAAMIGLYAYGFTLSGYTDILDTMVWISGIINVVAFVIGFKVAVND